MNITVKTKDLLKNIALFFIAVFIPKTVTFFLMPLYTSQLTTAEYGTIDILNSTVSLLLPFCTFQVQDAIMRYSLDGNVDRSEIYSIGFSIDIVGSSIVTMIIILLDYIQIINLDGVSIVFISVSLFLCGLINTSTYFCKGINKVYVISVGTVVNALLTIALNIILMVVFHMGFYGYVISLLCGYFANYIVIVWLAKLIDYFNYKINFMLCKEMLRFSIPMIISSMSWWINNASDKYLLSYFQNIDVVGLYAASSKIPTILSSLTSVISSAFSITAIKDFDKEDSDGFIGKTYTYIFAMTTMGCSALIILNIPLSAFLYSDDFFPAWEFVPPLLLSVVCGLMSGVCEAFFVALKKTKYISETAIIGAVINTILNIALIQMFGAYGAAIATLIGFLTIWMIRYIGIKKIISLKNSIYKEGCAFGILIIQMIFAKFFPDFYILHLGCFTAIGVIFFKEVVVILNKFKYSKLKRTNN